MGLFLGATSSIDYIITLETRVTVHCVKSKCYAVLLPVGAIMMLKCIRHSKSLGIFC